MTTAELESRITPKMRAALLAAENEPYTNPLRGFSAKKIGEGTEKCAWLINGVVVKHNTFIGHEKWTKPDHECLRELDNKIRKYGARLATQIIVGDWVVQEYVKHRLCTDVPWDIVPKSIKRLCAKVGFRGLTFDISDGNMGLTSLDGLGEYVVYDF